MRETRPTERTVERREARREFAAICTPQRAKVVEALGFWPERAKIEEWLADPRALADIRALVVGGGQT